MAIGHVEKRSQKGWTIVIEYGRQIGPDGKERRIRKKYATNLNKSDAKKRLHDMLSEINRGVFVEPSRTSLEEYLVQWYQETCANLAVRTRQGYRTNINNHIVPAIGHVKLCDLRQTHIRQFYAKLHKSGLAPRTIQYIHTNLRAALKCAVIDGIIQRNPTDGIKTPQSEPQRMQRQQNAMNILMPEEAAKLIEGCKDSYIFGVVMLALHTGMRRGELLALNWDDVHLDEGTIHVSQSLVKANGVVEYKPPKSVESQRVIPLGKSVINFLRSLESDHDLVFCYDDGSPLDPSSVTHTFRKVADKLGFTKVRFHDLRHTYATLGIDAGIDLPTMQELLGHSNIATTRIYVKVLTERKKQAAAIIDSLMPKSTGHQTGTNSP